MNILVALHRASQVGEGLFASKLSQDADITVRQSVLLAAIKDNPGVSQTVLRDATGIDRSTIADMVRRIQRKGWATRVRNKDDTRAFIVKITEAGMKALREAQSAAKKAEADLVEQFPGVKHLV